MNRNFFYYLSIVFIWVLYMPVVLSTYIIVWLDRKMKFLLSFPRDIIALTKAEKWCIAVLKKNNVLPADAEIKEYKVTSLNQDLIFRSNAGVIEINYYQRGENKTLKCFAKFSPTVGSIWNRTIFNLQLNHIKETSFNRYFVCIDRNIEAPKVYYTEMSFLTGNLCLITEHMSGCMEYLEGKNGTFPSAHITMAIEGMSTLHAHYWKNVSPRMKKVLPIENSTVLLFDSMVASSWSIHARNVLVKSWRRMNVRETILHGDARIGNMMFPKTETEGHFVFIDWQAVRQGKGVYDLAYFLILSLNTQFRVGIEKQCLEAYYNSLVAKGVSDYTKKKLEDDYRHACLCVLVLLSLPLLSGEASAEGVGAKNFVWGMNVWRERMEAKFAEFDYKWMANRYEMTEQQGREAVSEMLSVITQRLKRIEAAAAS